MAHETESSLSPQKPSPLLGLLGILVSAFAVWSLSKLYAPNERSSSSKHPQDSTYDAATIRQNISSPIHVVVDASPPTPTPDEKREAREERQEGRDKKRFRVEIIVAVVLAIYTVVTAFMWWATKNAAGAAKRSAEVASASLHLDQRAWISISRDSFQWSENSEMIFPSHILNTGKTLAKHLDIWTTAIPMKANETPDFSYEVGAGKRPFVRSKTGLLWPSAPVPFPLPVFEKAVPKWKKMTLTKSFLAEMQEGTSYVLIYGKATYEDMFGISHWVTFCDIYPANNRMFSELKDSYAKCIEYNNVDSNQ